jgi:hypothetical protein
MPRGPGERVDQGLAPCIPEEDSAGRHEEFKTMSDKFTQVVIGLLVSRIPRLPSGIAGEVVNFLLDAAREPQLILQRARNHLLSPSAGTSGWGSVLQPEEEAVRFQRARLVGALNCLGQRGGPECACQGGLREDELGSYSRNCPRASPCPPMVPAGWCFLVWPGSPVTDRRSRRDVFGNGAPSIAQRHR